MTDVERYESSSLAERYESPPPPTETEWRQMERMANMLAASGLVPDAFRGKPADVMIAGLALRGVGVNLDVTNLQYVYVVHGRPEFMAQLQAALLAHHGYDVHPVAGKCTATSATVDIEARDRSRHLVTFTWEDAAATELPKQNPMYRKWPDRMLVARATTKAIGQYHPEVKFGMQAAVATAAVTATQIAEGDDPSRPPGQAAGPGPEPGPAPSTRGPGYPPRPEDLATDTERAAVISLLDILDEDRLAAVRTKAKGIPNVRGANFTHDHASTLLGLLVAEVAAQVRHHGASPGTVAADAPGVPPTAGAADGGGSAQPPPSAPSYAPGEEPFE